MIKIGITGQSGFVGTHLYNYLGLLNDVRRIYFYDKYFDNFRDLKIFVKSCDVIIHLAGVNRHEDPLIIYEKNIELTKKLIVALETTDSKAHLIYSSSIQENRNNFYGKSKKESRVLLSEWRKKNEGQFTGLIIPNIFGPFGKPFYNSVISTFS